MSDFFVTFFFDVASNRCTTKNAPEAMKRGELLDNEIEKKLAVKAKHGNVDAYGTLIEHYKEYLYKTAMLSVKNEQIALDIVGDCILNGFRKIKSLKQPEFFKTWITRILYNAVSDYYRKEHYNEDLDNIQIPDVENALSKEERLDLYQAVDLLSDKYKTVIILRYFDEMKISDIAYVMGIPEGSVKAYLHRAKETLKHLLTEVDIYGIGV